MRSRGPPRPFLLAFAFAALAACGDPVPRYQLRTASEWVEMLRDADSRVQRSALESLAKFGERAPDAVLRALEAGLATPPPAATASPLSVALDLEEAKRLGLGAVTVSEAIGSAIEVMRGRALAAGAAPASFKGLADGIIDIVLSRPRPRDDVVRIQALFSTRGALAVRAIVSDPGPHADLMAAEARRYAEARAEKRLYAPSDARFRVVPRERSAAAPDEFVLVEEPQTDADALDERMVSTARAIGDARGARAVSISVRPERRDALRRFASRHKKIRMAVVLDGVLLGSAPVPETSGETLELPLWPAEGKGPALSAEELAIVLAAGRLPWPLKPIPLDPTYGTDPPPDNIIARAFAQLEGRAVPALTRLESEAAHAWARASARWALAQIRARAAAPGN